VHTHSDDTSYELQFQSGISSSNKSALHSQGGVGQWSGEMAHRQGKKTGVRKVGNDHALSILSTGNKAYTKGLT
jgi:hypothetical protein